MTVSIEPLFAFDNTYARDLAGLYEFWPAASVPEPRLLILNDMLAAELGLDAAALSSPAGVAVLAGNDATVGSTPLAQAYSGHQFGGFSPRLGDGRALLLGELLDANGRRRDIHLKGSGRTPFSRGGDGKAAVGPVLREYVMGEAMHALGIPTTRALAAIATGEMIRREGMLPGAVLVRTASSHLRVGTFQYAAAHGDVALVRRLADYAIARHYPAVAGEANPYLALVAAVSEAQASLMAKWMLVGFIHGVMNTDNMTIAGETIDYGPCAFMDHFDPATVFSSIDHGGRYAYGNQPAIAHWNLARLTETLLPLIDADSDRAVAVATDVLMTFPDRYEVHWREGMGSKLGLPGAADESLTTDLLTMLQQQKVDYTSFFRRLSVAVTGDAEPVRALFAIGAVFDRWLAEWRSQLVGDPTAVAAAMNAVNPIYIPRNHNVEAALAAAVDDDDLGPTRTLLDVLMRPFEERPECIEFASPAPASFGGYQTFCGT
jgi:serine/tyrosine/threonine adenylyltransferase